MRVFQTPTFVRQTKKLNKNRKIGLNAAVQKVIKNPSVGVMKKSDLHGVRVYKFKMVNQLTLLAYEFHKNDALLILLAVGPHENFYRDLKK